MTARRDPRAGQACRHPSGAFPASALRGQQLVGKHIDVARVAIYDQCLTAAEAAELGRVPTWSASDLPPTIQSGASLPANAGTTQSVVCNVAASDADSATVRIRLDWGDGGEMTREIR